MTKRRRTRGGPPAENNRDYLEKHLGHYLNHLLEPYRTTQHDLYYHTQDGYDKLHKPRKSRGDTRRPQKEQDRYLDQLMEPYNNPQNYHRLRETHEGVSSSQPKNEGNLQNYLHFNTELCNTTKDYLNYPRRRHHKRRQRKTDKYARRPGDQNSRYKNYDLGGLGDLNQGHRRRHTQPLGHHLDSDLYPNAELYYKTKDYLNYPRRRRNKRRQKRNDQGTRRPGDQDNLHENYDLNDGDHMDCPVMATFGPPPGQRPQSLHGALQHDQGLPQLPATTTQQETTEEERPGSGATGRPEQPPQELRPQRPQPGAPTTGHTAMTEERYQDGGQGDCQATAVEPDSAEAETVPWHPPTAQWRTALGPPAGEADLSESESGQSHRRRRAHAAFDT